MIRNEIGKEPVFKNFIVDKHFYLGLNFFPNIMLKLIYIPLLLIIT